MILSFCCLSFCVSVPVICSYLSAVMVLLLGAPDDDEVLQGSFSGPAHGSSSFIAVGNIFGPLTLNPTDFCTVLPVRAVFFFSCPFTILGGISEPIPLLNELGAFEFPFPTPSLILISFTFVTRFISSLLMPPFPVPPDAIFSNFVSMLSTFSVIAFVVAALPIPLCLSSDLNIDLASLIADSLGLSLRVGFASSSFSPSSDSLL